MSESKNEEKTNGRPPLKFDKYFRFPDELEISPIEGVVFGIIWGFSENNQDCYATNETIAEYARTSVKTVVRSIAALKEKNMIEFGKQHSNGFIKHRNIVVTKYAKDLINGSQHTQEGQNDPNTRVKMTSVRGSKCPSRGSKCPSHEGQNDPQIDNRIYNINRQCNKQGERESGGARGTSGASGIDPNTLTIKQFIELDDEAKNDFLNNIRDDCFGYDKRFTTTDDIFTSRENKRFAAEIQEDCLRTIGSSEEIFTQERKDALFDDIVERILNRI